MHGVGVSRSQGGGEDIWEFSKMGVPPNGWFTMEIPMKMDDLEILEAPLFQETSISPVRQNNVTFWLLNLFGC